MLTFCAYTLLQHNSLSSWICVPCLASWFDQKIVIDIERLQKRCLKPLPIIFIHWGVKSFWLDHYYIIAVVKGFCGLHQLILWSRLVNKPSVQDGLIEWVTESLAGSLWKNFVSARNRPTCCRFTRVLCLENISHLDQFYASSDSWLFWRLFSVSFMSLIQNALGRCASRVWCS